MPPSPTARGFGLDRSQSWHFGLQICRRLRRISAASRHSATSFTAWKRSKERSSARFNGLSPIADWAGPVSTTCGSGWGNYKDGKPPRQCPKPRRIPMFTSISVEFYSNSRFILSAVSSKASTAGPGGYVPAKSRCVPSFRTSRTHSHSLHASSFR